MGGLIHGPHHTGDALLIYASIPLIYVRKRMTTAAAGKKLERGQTDTL